MLHAPANTHCHAQVLDAASWQARALEGIAEAALAAYCRRLDGSASIAVSAWANEALNELFMQCSQPSKNGLQGDTEQGRAAAVEGLAVGLVQASVSGTGPSQALAGMLAALLCTSPLHNTSHVHRLLFGGDDKCSRVCLSSITIEHSPPTQGGCWTACCATSRA